MHLTGFEWIGGLDVGPACMIVADFGKFMDDKISMPDRTDATLWAIQCGPRCTIWAKDVFQEASAPPSGSSFSHGM